MGETTITESSISKNKPASEGNLWLILLVAWLGWMFDGMEMGFYSVLAAPALKELLKIEDATAIAPTVTHMFALFLLGAAIGGFIFGRLGDKIGRTKTMILTIGLYSLCTGLTALTQNVWQFGLCRFIGAMGLGGEWGLGIALVMETWPNARRPVLAGLLGSAANVGFLVSSLINLAIGDVVSWRHIFAIGLVPALLTLVIRIGVKEPERWMRVRERKERQDVLQIFEGPYFRKTVVCLILSSISIVGTWGIFQLIPTWVNAMVGGLAPDERARSAMYMAFGQIFGSFIGGPMAEWFGRRISFSLYCIGSLVSGLIMYSMVHEYGPFLLGMAVVMGIFTTTFFGWFPLYLPEIYPTRIRATGEGLTFNFGRILAAVAVFNTGYIVKALGGYAQQGFWMSFVFALGLILIWLVPETKGCELPE
ncbi:MAG: MFS transporter [Armatimonadetes bacterium]|nr:MFS transporter [Armatimonadota bacterium]